MLGQPPPQTMPNQPFYHQQPVAPGYNNPMTVGMAQNPYPTVASYYQTRVQPAGAGYAPNLNVNSFSSAPTAQLVPKPKGTLEDYISRAFNKCITPSERVYMSKALKEITVPKNVG